VPNPTFTPNLNLVLLAAATRGWGDVVNATYSTIDGLTPVGSLAVAPADLDPVTGASTSLRVKVSAGSFRKSDGTSVSFAGSAGTTLPASQVSYLYLDDSGNLQANQTGVPTGVNVVPLASVVAGASTVTRVTDRRAPFMSFGAPAPFTPPPSAANLVYAGPASGTASSASFRALAAADMPGAVVQSITLNTPNVLYTSPVAFTVANGAATAALTMNTQAANTFLAGPTAGAPAVPTMRMLAAADLPTTGLLINSHHTIIAADADAATVTFDMSAADVHAVTLGGNRALALANDMVGQTFRVVLRQDATGGRTVTWWSGILWPGGTAPTLSAAPNKRDVFSFLKTAAGEYLGLSAVLNL
jgi:hypothetical protein